MNFTKRLLILLLLLFPLASICQQKKITIFPFPLKYKEENDGDILRDSKEKGTHPKENWIVFTDKDGVVSRESSNDNAAAKKTIGFMEAFYVSEEEDNYLHLYKYDFNKLSPNRKERFTYLALSGDDYGWVSKNDLVLSTRSLESKTTSLYRKALPIIKQGNEKKIFENAKEGAFSAFENPQLSKKSSKSCNMFQILFVFKENKETNSLLLGVSNTINAEDPKSRIYGWVKKEFLQEWDNRICIEPNWEDNAVEERKEKKINCSIFKSVEDASNWAAGNTSNSNWTWNKDPFDNRWDGSQKRLPILNYVGPDKNIIQTGKVTGLVDKNNTEQVSAENIAKIDDKAAGLILTKRKYNVVFVVDGSYDMKHYLEVVKSSIAQIEKNNKLKTQAIEGSSGDAEMIANKYKYACVIYRGLDDERKCPSINIESCPESKLSTATEVTDWVEEKQQISVCESVTGNRNIKLGLQKGLRKFNDKNETNIIVLIGGCKTENKDDVGDNEIIKSLNNKNVTLLAFQAENKGFLASKGYNEFARSFINILREYSKNEFEIIRNSKTQEKQKLNCKIGDEFSEIEEGYKYNLNYPNCSPFPGSLFFAKEKSNLDLSEITNQIFKTTNEREAAAEIIIESAQKEISGFGERNNVVINAEYVAFKIALGEILSEKDLQKDLSKIGGVEQFQFFIPGYTSLTNNKMDLPAFKKVLFLTDFELDGLLVELKNLIFDQGSPEDLRGKMYSAFIQVVSNYLGEDKVKQAIKSNKKVSEIMELITGFKTSNDLLNIGIEDFKNAQKVNNAKLSNLKTYITKKYDDLNKSRSNKKTMMETTWGSTFYWIDESIMP